MRGLVLLVLLLPTAMAQAATLRVEPAEPGDVALDTAHLSARLRFRVTNLASEPDYVTIPRNDMRWTDTGETALGFPSPEFGRPLAPGESALMWAHVDLPEPRTGTRTVEIPFRSERTGAQTAARATLTVAPAPPAEHRLAVKTDPPGAAVHVTDLDSVVSPDVEGARDPGGWSARVAPGLYAVRADAPGRQGATRFVDVRGDTDVRLDLAPARWRADVTLTRASADESAWLLAASADLERLVTAPMVHTTPDSPGAFVGFTDGRVAWRAPFAAPAQSRHGATAFQALDTSAAVSPDGARAAGFDWNGRVHVFDAATGAPLWSDDAAGERHPLYPPTSAFGEGYYTSGAVAFSPDGALLAAGGSNGRLTVYEAADGARRWTRSFGAEIRALRFGADGTGLHVGSGDWRFHHLDAATGQTRWSAGEPEFWPFFFIAESEAGDLVAAGGKDSVYRVWNATDGRLEHAVDVFPAFVTGGGVGAWGGTMSDWGYGVRAFDAEGEPTWFRRFKAANAATTADGAFTLVAWANQGGNPSGLALLDDTGTTLWTSPPDAADACTSQASPFPARQLKSVHLVRLAPDRLRFAAACIGGGVFTGEAALTPIEEPPTPMATPSPSPQPTPSPQPSPTPQPSPQPSPTPLPWWLALAALAATVRRRR